jgi:hypothetical protein
MSQPEESVREFINDSYQLVSASTPTVPLKGNDLSQGIKVLNRVLAEYSAAGLLLTIPKQVDTPILTGQGRITYGDPSYVPTPDVPQGRISNLLNAWITLNNVNYPLIVEKDTEFFSSYKYEPLLGLPRYIIMQPQTNLTLVQVFPAPSQAYLLSIYAKFQLIALTSNDTMTSLPDYMYLYLQFAIAKYLAFYKARSEAWTEKLEQEYLRLKATIEATSTQNLDINVNQESWLNGAYRVRAGI